MAEGWWGKSVILICTFSNERCENGSDVSVHDLVFFILSYSIIVIIWMKIIYFRIISFCHSLVLWWNYVERESNVRRIWNCYCGLHIKNNTVKLRFYVNEIRVLYSISMFLFYVYLLPAFTFLLFLKCNKFNYFYKNI